MSTIAPTREDVAAAETVVDQIDLAPINAKLRHDDPETWTDQSLGVVERRYRRFLVLNLLHPHTTLSVDKGLDAYWHQHILDTRKYAADCELIFGYFLHHYPYFGMDDAVEWQENIELYAATQQLYEDAFGADPPARRTLTIDKVVGGYQSTPDRFDATRIYAFPQACKSGQHCPKIIIPERFDPGIRELPREPFDPPLRPFEPGRTPGPG
ncbi:MAG: hypothetical protein ABW328_01840 [Ilumatobacteraceae bacterium]